MTPSVCRSHEGRASDDWMFGVRDIRLSEPISTGSTTSEHGLRSPDIASKGPIFVSFIVLLSAPRSLG
jgi:hypothetical protein